MGKTTILGIKAENAIVLGSDNQVNYIDTDDNLTETMEEDACKFRKVNEHFAFLYTGTSDNQLEIFLDYLTNPNRQVEGLARAIAGRNWQKRVGGDPRVLLTRYRRGMERRLKKIASNSVDKEALSPIETALVESLDDNGKKGQSPVDQFFIELYQNILSESYKGPISDAIKNEFFWELNFLNTDMAKREGGDEGAELIMAGNSPVLELYHMDSFGNVIPCQSSSGIEYICLGTGSDEVKKYFSDSIYKSDEEAKRLKELNPDLGDVDSANLTAEAAATLCMRALERVKDAMTGNITEPALITKRNVFFFGDDITERVKKAKNQGYAGVIKACKRIVDEEQEPQEVLKKARIKYS
jgi:20S proteasome alpha/beta subunit